jgi:ABC-2 type transport system permease protein
VFFSIFASIFGGMGAAVGGGGGSSAMGIIVVDEDQTEISRRFVEAVNSQEALDVAEAPRRTDENPHPEPFTRESARQHVRQGGAPIAVIIPAGFSETFGNFVNSGADVDLVYDAANPIAQPTVAGLLQAAAFMAAPDILMENGLEQFDAAGGMLTDDQRAIMQQLKPFLRGEQPWSGKNDEPADEPVGGAATDVAGASPPEAFQGLVVVNAIRARAVEDEDGGEGPDMTAYYAAGISVMFLLFSMAGVAGTLLEEEERGTLERLLTTKLGMGTFLAGQWLFFALIGVLQIILMFVWGAVMFDLDLWSPNHLAGFAAMTLVTGGAAASFGIMLATVCRSRAQLGGISTVVILIMSALGGSMVPRFVMPEFMDTTAKFTFNGWALDGYLKVFWYDDPGQSLASSLASIIPEITVLAAATVVFLGLARLMARRWEAI